MINNLSSIGGMGQHNVLFSYIYSIGKLKGMWSKQWHPQSTGCAIVDIHYLTWYESQLEKQNTACWR